MKKIAFVETTRHEKPASELFKADPSWIFGGVNGAIAGDLEKRGLPCRSLEECLDPSRLQPIETEAWRIARSWHASKALRPYLEYQGWNLGFLSELYWGNYLTWILKRWTQIEVLLNDELPDEILCFGSDAADREIGEFFPSAEEIFCAKVFRFLGKAVRTADQRDNTTVAHGSTNFQESAKNILRRIAAVCCRHWPHPKRENRPQILICSALHHVRGVVEALAGRHELVFLDESFRLAKLPFLVRHGARYLTYSEIACGLGGAARQRLKEFKERIAENRNAIKSVLREDKVFVFEGINFSDLIEDRLDYFSNQMLPRAAESIEVFRALYRKERFQVVVVDEDTVTFRKALVNLGREAGVRSLQIPHGVNLADIQYDLLPVSSDRLAVGGPSIKKYYQARGVPAEKIEVTGIPRYDSFKSADFAVNRSRVFSELKLQPGTKLITLGWTLTFQFDATRTQDQQDIALKDVLQIFSRLENCFLLVKLHPLDENPKRMEAILAGGTERAKVTRTFDAVSAIAASDAVLSFQSNFAIESFALGRPTIVLDYFPYSRSEVPFFREAKPPLSVKNASELEASLKRILSEDPDTMRKIREAEQWFQKEWVGPLDGQSSRRIASFVESMINHA